MKTLTEQFKSDIDFDTFLATSSFLTRNGYDIKTDRRVALDYIDTHVQNKQHIFSLFGNKLRVEKEIDVTVSRDKIMDAMNEFVSYLNTNKKFIFAKALINNLYYEDFSNNILGRDYSFFNVSLKKGMKISKALTKLLLPEHHHEVITKHSMIYQTLFTKGKVVLSIDPVDYITMSSNGSGWKSCHRLNGGEYATGPLSYLNDDCTVICYIESSKPCKFDYMNKEYEHSNKTWRQIALVDPNLTYSIQERQYPNNNGVNADAVADLFKELFAKRNEKNYQFTIGEVCGDLDELHVDYAVKEDAEALYYNDTYHEMYSYGHVVHAADTNIENLKDLDPEDKPLKGGPAYCLNCGDQITSSGAPFCYDCYEDDDEW